MFFSGNLQWWSNKHYIGSQCLTFSYILTVEFKNGVFPNLQLNWARYIILRHLFLWGKIPGTQVCVGCLLLSDIFLALTINLSQAFFFTTFSANSYEEIFRKIELQPKFLELWRKIVEVQRKTVELWRKIIELQTTVLELFWKLTNSREYQKTFDLR